MRRTLLIALFTLLPALAVAGPAVTVSVQPVHSLVAGVMQGVAEPHLLLRGGSSPHTHNLRPSDARALQESDLVIWVGPELEGFLTRALSGLAADVPQLTLSALPEIELLPARSGGQWDDDHGHHHHHGHDMHLWLDPANAAVIVEQSARRLSEIDPANAARYQANAQRLQQQLEQLDAQLEQRLAPVREQPYVVFHDAYQYFEQRYRLNAVGSVTVSPERAPGARRVSQLRSKIQDLEARCIFREPQFEASLVQPLTRGTQTRVGVLDPLGADIAPGPGHYFELMNQLAAALTDCLQP